MKNLKWYICALIAMFVVAHIESRTAAYIDKLSTHYHTVRISKSVGIISMYMRVHKRGYEYLEKNENIGTCWVVKWKKKKYVITADHVFTLPEAVMDTISFKTLLEKKFKDVFRYHLLADIPMDTSPVRDSLTTAFFVEFSGISFPFSPNQALAIPSSGSDYLVLVPPDSATPYLPDPLDCAFDEPPLYPLDRVVAIGSYYQYPNIFSEGIITKPQFSDPSVGPLVYILSDAKIVPGSSGGVLVLKDSWKIIGINVQIFLPEEAPYHLYFQAYSEPTYYLKKIFEKLEKDGAIP